MPFRAFVVLTLGVLFLVTGILMSRSKLPRRLGIGMRSNSMRQSDTAWQAGHRAVAIPLAGYGIANLALSVWMFASYGDSSAIDQAITGTRAALWYIGILAAVLMLLSTIADFKARIALETEAAATRDQPEPEPE